MFCFFYDKSFFPSLVPRKNRFSGYRNKFLLYAKDGLGLVNAGRALFEPSGTLAMTLPRPLARFAPCAAVTRGRCLPANPGPLFH
jgi:hypothetical protein